MTSTTSGDGIEAQTVAVTVVDEKGDAKPADEPAEPKKKGGIRRKSIQAIKANPKKTAAGCGCCCICLIVVIVLVVVLTAAAAAGYVYYNRYFYFEGNVRESALGGAAMGAGGKKSLVPQKEDETVAAAARRRRLDTTTTTLGKCPRDSQVVIESEATPSSVYDGTTIFQFVDQVQCLLQLTRPGTDETINQGPYTAIVNENKCAPSSDSSGGGGGGGLSGAGSSMGGGGGGAGGGSAASAVKLKTFGVNSSKPSEANPQQPFEISMVMPIVAPEMSSSSPSASSPSASPSASTTPKADHMICFSFTGWKFDNVTNQFTEYDLVFASCTPPPIDTPGFQIRGHVRVQAPDGSVNLNDMQTMVTDATGAVVTSEDWSDMKFDLIISSDYGGSDTKQGRSIYQRHKAVGCAKSREGGLEGDMCFNDGTLKSAFLDPFGTTAAGNITCKSRDRTVTVTDPYNYKAFKLCDDDTCTGAHDCKESGPVNSISFYTCLPGTGALDDVPGCEYQDREYQGHMYSYSVDSGVHTYWDKMWSQWGEPSRPPSPAPPPPSQRAPYESELQDGQTVWKDNYHVKDDVQYMVHKIQGRLVRVRQDRMRLCDLPGTYTLGRNQWGPNKVMVSFQPDGLGECSGKLHEVEGIKVGAPLTIGREHLDRYLNPERPQYAILTNGNGGGAEYHLPVQTEYWQMLRIHEQYDYVTGTSNYEYRFASSPTAGTKVSALEEKWDWDENAYSGYGGYTQTLTEANFTVAATTFQITVEQDYAEMYAKDLADRDADPDCASCDPTTACAEPPCLYNDCPFYPEKCHKMECTAIGGIGCAATNLRGEVCSTCYGYSPSNTDEYQMVRIPTANDATTGAIVAEVLSEVNQRSVYDPVTYATSKTIKTFLIQCVSTTGNALLSNSSFTPQDTGVAEACGLTASTSTDSKWLRGPDVGRGMENALLGKIVSIDKPTALLVTAPTILSSYGYFHFKSGVTAWNGTHVVDASLINFYPSSWASFPGKVTSQPTGATLANYTIKEAVRPDETIQNLKCLDGCIDPAKMGTSANPPTNSSVLYSYAAEYGDCVNDEWKDCYKPYQYDQAKVPLNHTFKEYAWTATGLQACSFEATLAGVAEAGSGVENVMTNCTAPQPVAVPKGTSCMLECHNTYGGLGDEQQCHCSNWQVKSILFQNKQASEFKCPAVAGEASASGTTPKACLTYWSTSGSGQTANIDDLDEYYEYHTAVPSEWQSQDTVWLEPIDDAGRVLQPEPPLQLTLQVPCTGAPNSISGIDYSCKKLTLEFSEGIDLYNSPGFPMWCLNRMTGETKPPIMSQYGSQECMDWSKMDYTTMDYESQYFEMYPDINPDIDWEANDGKTLKWGIKPAEKTIIYTKVADSNCTQNFANPITIENEGDMVFRLDTVMSQMREKVAPLLSWYGTNKALGDALRVHTGSIVGNASMASARRARRMRRLAARQYN